MKKEYKDRKMSVLIERTKKLKGIIKQLRKDGVRCTCSPNGRKWSLPSATCPGHSETCELYKQGMKLI